MAARKELNVDLPALRFVMQYSDAISKERIKLESRGVADLIRKIHRCRSLLCWMINKNSSDCLLCKTL